MDRVIIFDTTLRDGEQSPGISLDVGEKLEIADQLARLGVDYIEAGFPIASQGDFEAVLAIAKSVRGPVICGLSRTALKDIDRCWEAIEPAEKHRIHTFIATSETHMKHKLRMTPDQVLNEAARAVAHARNYTADVEFSPEDASRSDFDFMCTVLQAAVESGATTLNIPDTVGYSTPKEYGALIGRIAKALGDCAIVSVHCHDDLGFAVANSLAAVEAGARQIECTINGIGERAGNCSLEEIVMILKTRPDSYGYHTGVHTEHLFSASQLLTSMITFGPQPLAVDLLVQAVVVADSILKEKRRWPHLTGMVATFDEVGVLLRIAQIDSHRFIPMIGNWDQMRIDRCPEFT